jgi:FkbM family methyltransferase
MREHHPVFAEFQRAADPVTNWLGVTTRRDFFTEELEFVRVARPSIDTEYFEWIDLLEAVTAATDRFTMLELGAGYGRWIVNAAAAVRAYSGIPATLVAVEAEPTHFEWLEQHCRDNDVEAEVVQAAVAPVEGEVAFAVGNAAGWYGQAIADDTWSPGQTQTVPAVTLSSLLARHERIDLVHMDVQGVEADVLEEARGELSRVRRVHVGTHGRMQEKRIRTLFTGLGWRSQQDYPSAARSKTPWGKMEFQDGVQTWINPSTEGARLR